MRVSYRICGPPGVGKTTYCREKASYGDLILDVEMLITNQDDRALLRGKLYEARDHLGDIHAVYED